MAEPGARGGPPHDLTAPPRVDRRLVAAGRELLAWLLAGTLGALAYLVVIQESANRGWSDHKVVDAVGILMGAEGQDVPRQGFYWSIVFSLAIVLVYAAVPRLRPLPFAVRAGILGVTVLLLWGLVLCPLASARSDEVIAGAFALDAGVSSLVVGVLAAAVYGISAARVHGLVVSAEWWEVKHFDLRASLDEIVQTGPAARPGDGPPEGVGEDPTVHPPFRH